MGLKGRIIITSKKRNLKLDNYRNNKKLVLPFVAFVVVVRDGRSSCINLKTGRKDGGEGPL